MATASLLLDSEQPCLSSLKRVLPLIGLTGGIGSGKTAVSDLLGKLGAGIIDTDLIAHQITAPQGAAIQSIKDSFGAEFIDSSGALDRSKMRALVFAKPEARKALEAITHPLIRQETIRQATHLAKSGAPYLVFVVPLLLESGSWETLIDLLVVVDCPEATQIERVMQRSNLSRQEVEKILQAQATREQRLTRADMVIQNQGALGDLEPEVIRLHQKILQIQKDLLSSS
ncbi:dephospho-CoA kinase [Polynucleobacter sp. UK-Kesae-W10]|uniref:dephospho-CoA kinase n=1 Tax=Polynucleobacter sp. UK-Kesae-W10 TaxID=1819738 RepID=UPI001C0C2A77|nr:dephospho-CoA kinase [Polynucleobacter sp. UK-Kesae-W10]MBU3576803.1 dephospho-CoA kinase [Polynucleobacter sp. UK-Kesae-W10]